MVRLRVLLILAALSLAALAPSAHAAPVPYRACDSGDSNHVFSLKAFRGARCGSALVVATRLARRYDRPGDFDGRRSGSRIKQKDARGKRYVCRWQSASPGNEIALWSCRRKGAVVTWVWRFHAL